VVVSPIVDEGVVHVAFAYRRDVVKTVQAIGRQRGKPPVARLDPGGDVVGGGGGRRREGKGNG
jgi:hypothetical protein